MSINELDDFSILPNHQRKIIELVKKSKKFSSTNDFVRNAIDILLAWESEHPEDCLAITKSLKPWTIEQEKFIQSTMRPEEITRNFGTLEIEKYNDEIIQQHALGQTNYDHMKLQGNYQNIIKYIKNFKIFTPENIVPYDGYPLLSINYSRFFPIKLTVLMLGYMLESKKTNKIELKDLRVNAYDLLEEYGILIRKYEKSDGISRQNKISTGLPRKYDDDEKNSEMKIRIKDIQVGKVRTSRKLGGEHLDGALSATGLVTAFIENDTVFVTLTELGKKFILLENPIFPNHEFSKGGLSPAEIDFIIKNIIPQRQLEAKIIQTIQKTLSNFEKSVSEGVDDDKYAEDWLASLENDIQEQIRKYAESNPEIAKKFNLIDFKKDTSTVRNKVKQIRLAIMGRLVELGIVNWEINKNSISKYYIREEPK